MLLKFHPGKLSHIGPGGRVLDVVGTANNVSPQSNHFLALDELRSLSDTAAVAQLQSLPARVLGGSFLVLGAGIAAEKMALRLSLHICAASPRQRLNEADANTDSETR